MVGTLPPSIALAILLVGPSLAQDDQPVARRELEEIRQTIGDAEDLVTDLGRRSEELAGELDRLRDQMAAATIAIQPIEAEIAALENRIGELTVETAEREQELTDRRQTMADALAALQRLALRPPAALLVSPGGANDIVRTGLLLRSAIPLLEAQAASLRTEMDALARLKVELDERRAALGAARADLQAEQDRLTSLVGRKEELLGGLMAHREATQEQIAESLSRAGDLEELLAELQRRAAAEAARAGDANADAQIFRLLRPVAGATGRMTAPAQGRLLHGFGDANEFGGTHRGVTFTTPAGARVVAPWDGKIVFAGPFQDFGLILIIDHGEAYHSLIAGFEEIDAVVDQWVLAGEPIGTTYNGSGNDDFVSDVSGDQAPSGSPGGIANGSTLYVELRAGGTPVNPLPWLAAQSNRVQ